MPIVYQRFADVPFQLYDGTHPLDSGTMDLDLIPLASGGAYNPHGSATGHHAGLRLALVGTIMAQSWTEARDHLQRLQALRFQEGRLTRQSIGDGRQERATAILTGVDGDWDDSQRGPQIEIRCDFAVTSPVWSGTEHGPGWFFDSGVMLDSGRAFDEATGDTFTLDGTSPDTIALVNSGNVAQTNVQLKVTVGTPALTSIRIAGGGTDITWTGTAAAGSALIFDGGAWSVTNAGADAYSGLVFNSGHSIDTMFRLVPGSTSYTVSYTGGGTTTVILATFNDAWA